MKTKRILTVVITVMLLVVGVVPIMAGTAKSKTLKHPDLFVNLYGYLDFDNGILLCQDYYSYITSLSGEKVDIQSMIGTSHDS